MKQYGCDNCWSNEATVAFETVTAIPIEQYLIDESHYIVSIRRCSTCSQRYLQVTTETIDWADGEDPIFRTIIPIEADEYARLTVHSPPGTHVLESIGQDRRSLKYDWPKGKPPKIYWSIGVTVGIHD